MCVFLVKRISSVVERPLLEAKIPSVRNIFLLWDLSVPYCVHESPPFNCKQSHIYIQLICTDCVARMWRFSLGWCGEIRHIISPYFVISLIIIFPFMPWFPKWPLPFRICDRSFAFFLVSPVPGSRTFLYLNTLIISCVFYKTTRGAAVAEVQHDWKSHISSFLSFRAFLLCFLPCHYPFSSSPKTDTINELCSPYNSESFFLSLHFFLLSIAVNMQTLNWRFLICERRTFLWSLRNFNDSRCQKEGR